MAGQISVGKAAQTWKLVLAVMAILSLSLLGATSASAAFGIAAFDGRISEANGSLHTQASGHPFEIVTHIDMNSHVEDSLFLGPVEIADAPPKDFFVDLPNGFVGNATFMDECTGAQLLMVFGSAIPPAGKCPTGSQIGYVHINDAGTFVVVPLWNIVPPHGIAARFGFNFGGSPVLLDAKVRGSGANQHLAVDSANVSQALPIKGATVTFWGVPADPAHDENRCYGLGNFLGNFEYEEVAVVDPPFCRGPAGAQNGPHSLGEQPIPFLTQPSSCNKSGEGMQFDLRADSWDEPGIFDEDSFQTHQPPGFPAPEASRGPTEGISDCDRVPVSPEMQVQPTAEQSETSTGLEVELTIPDDGFLNPDGLAQSTLKKTVVTLPQGVTANPSSAEGLGTCKTAEFEEESVNSTPEQGCPSTSKLGSVEVETPALKEKLTGSLFLATPDDPSAAGKENPFDSLLALYIVARSTERGVIVKLPGKVEPDPNTGRLVTTFDDLPQLPFSKFTLKFREGPRAPLVTPPTCGTYTTQADFVPWSAKDPNNPTPNEVVHSTSTFEVTSGVNSGPCPPGGVPGFKPGFTAGSINNNAGSFTPFNMRLTRQDGEQNMTRFSSILPPGVLGKLAGVSKCSDAAIALAKTKTGKQELASPSCPSSSQVGRILVGAGVGSVLTYVGGKVYLAGPYAGDPLSVVVVTPAVAGPFDVGTVVVREALTLNPKTAEVEVDGASSDPIPHILKGIPLKLRDLRVYVDRNNFILNPTSCDPSQVKATLFGSYVDVFNPADDVPVGLASRFQAANCSSLGFKPALKIALKGGTKRGGHPALRAVLNARPGDANIGAATVTLPKSAFLDQAHIRTICTRVQFAAKQCPKGAIYGYAKAFTPLLDEPIQGPVYLRSSNHKLPDLVADLKGLVDVEIVGRLDSFKGGIRSSFESIPDAPVSKFVLTMQGGKKGLVINSRNLCASKNRADARFTGQNGKAHDFRPVMEAKCSKGRRGKR